MRTEVGRETGEWRRRGVLLLLLLVCSELLMLLLLCHAGPELHAISRHNSKPSMQKER